ncbi:MAG: hypothetical protein V9F00_07295 [Nocardioides sp.]
MKRLVIVVAAAMAAAFAWFGQVSAAEAMPTPGAPTVAYTYDAPHPSTEHNNTAT